VEKIRAGARLLIKPGAQFPVDAEIAKGNTAADESNLTGEAAPVEKIIGDTVLAGTINLWGAVEVIVTKAGRGKFAAKNHHAHPRGAAAKSARATVRRQVQHVLHLRRARPVARDVFCVVAGLSFASIHKCYRLAHRNGSSAFYRTMTLLVVSSPCALVLSIPSAVLAAIAWAARHGILFRGGAAVEKLAEVNIVALDKTGTLTTGELRVEKVESFPPGRENEIAQLAYSLEKLSTHPLARAITRHGKQQTLAPLEFSQFESVTGQGLEGARAMAKKFSLANASGLRRG
jgi:Cd2+/Zn2+-exporting ATPase